jgi:hypothetical protein
VGDRIYVDSHKISSVLAIFRHHRSSIPFIELHTINNKTEPLRLTPLHSILLRKSNERIEQYRFARDVSVGDFVFSISSGQLIEITAVRSIVHVEEYAYAPLTFEGTIVANSLIASCYATFCHSIMHILMTPIRWWYWLLIQFQQPYLHKLSTIFCVRFVDLYLWLFF